MKILYVVRPVFKLDYQIMNIDLDFFTENILKNYLYFPLVSYSCIVKCEGHNLIAQNAFRWAVSCGVFIFWHHLNLIVSYGTVHQRQCFMPCSSIN